MIDALPEEPDPYGNLGAISDASWEARWMRWPKSDRDDYLASIAHWGPMDITQMAHLIQGLLPPTYEWLPLPTCMVEFLPVVKRLEQDIARGDLPQAPTPNEFAAWCDFMRIPLPEPLVRAIHEVAALPKVTHVPRQSTIEFVGPAWAPIPIPTGGQTVKPRSPPKRGRPVTTAPKLDVILSDAKGILMEAARKGEVLTITALAKQLLTTPNGGGMTVPNLERRLKGVLPTAQARATATKYQVAARGAVVPNMRPRNLY